MLWVLWDIVLPLIATFLLGLLVGWLLWRWRRKRMSAEDLSALRRGSARNKADLERLQQSNMELSDRLHAVTHNGDSHRNVDDANGKEATEQLWRELTASRNEVARLQALADTMQVESTPHQSGADTQAQSQLDAQRLAQADRDNDKLREEVDARDRMIATLRASLEQFGEQGDNTALMADVALRDRKISELEAMVKALKR